jgi:hypothetical protein
MQRHPTVLSLGRIDASKLVDNTPVTINGKKFDVKSLPAIKPPALKSIEVPKRLPSIVDRKSSKGKEKYTSEVPLSPLRTVVLSPLGTPVSSSRERKVIRVIRAAPKGLFNIPRMPDYTLLTDIEKEALRVKFDLKLQQLQKANPNLVPFGKNEPLHIIHVKYDQYVRQAYVEKTVIKYKIYLTIFFLVIEALGTKVLGIPISGYTSDQISQFMFYEQLLLELAERSKSSGGDDWPVEIRIFLYMLYQVVIFMVIRFVSSFLPAETVKDLRAQINDIMVGTKAPVISEDGLPEPPRSSNFDPTNLMASLGSLFAGSKSKPKSPVNISEHKPPFEE